MAATLREARHGRGLSLREAAKLIGCTKGHLSMLELAQRAPSVAMGAEISRVYRLDSADAERLSAESVPGVGRSKTRRRAAA
jgi:transcriptional regulator with XRE-family HTH domain